LWTAGVSRLNSTLTYRIDPDTGPIPFDNAFWSDLGEPHNSFQQCVPDRGGSLSRDGSALYLSRYSKLQVFDFSSCMGPTPAVAEVTVTPSVVFPGQSVLVNDQTSGSYDRWALWVEKNGVFETGDTTPSDNNPHSFQFTVPADVAEGDTFTANILIESDDEVPADADDTTPIAVDFSPQASLTITPEAAIVGDTVTLSSTAEGVPTSFNWIIDPPASSSFTREGQATQVNLNESGVWKFYLTVNFAHGASGAGDPDNDGLYEATDEDTAFNVSSVAADFTIVPVTPLDSQDVVLNGSASKGNISSYLWTVYGPLDRSGDGIQPTDYESCPNAITCTIPGDSLPWGSYSVTLEVANDQDETDSLTRPMNIANGSIQPVITWSPSTPDRGEQVTFRIEGVEPDITEATWNMGGGSCDGGSSTVTCTPSLFEDCKAVSWTYSSSGDKTLSLTVEIDGVEYTDIRPAAERTVTVSTSGSCSGGDTCEYSLSKTQASYGPSGGSGSVQVQTGYRCDWTASVSGSFIDITDNQSGSGPGTIQYDIDPNFGPPRSGSISVRGKRLNISQGAPAGYLTFDWSPETPRIGERVTFSANESLEIESWSFSEAACGTTDTTIPCIFGGCSEVEWAFPSGGTKTVTMRLKGGQEETVELNVLNEGQCCFKDGPPDAGFTASSDEIYAGERVTFTDASVKTAKSLEINWSPFSPDIGQQVTFILSGVNGDIDQVTWDFGNENGCDNADPKPVCIPSLFDNCKGQAFTFASGGTKTVSAVVAIDGGSPTTVGPVSVNVSNNGSCDGGGGGGGGGCSYSLSSGSTNFGPDGGEGAFVVNTTSECSWTASTGDGWIILPPTSGTGTGTVSFQVGSYEGEDSRTGRIEVENRTHTVRQNPPAPVLDTAPTQWWWTVTRIIDGNETVIENGGAPVFSFVFPEPGTYRVELEAGNCYGSNTFSQTYEVLELLASDVVVGAAVSAGGANETVWESDFRFFNPCGEPLDVRIEFQPEDTHNTGAQLVFREGQMAPNQTVIFSNIAEAIPGLAGQEELSGSVRVESESASGCKVLSVSRTFNTTDNGTLGLFVPALPVKSLSAGSLDIAGLMKDQHYRTNLRLVNFGDEDAWVGLKLFQRSGEQIGDDRSLRVLGNSTTQINDVTTWFGVEDDLKHFSVRADVTGLDVQALATVVDNVTGDSVLFMSTFNGENKVWLVGVANQEGVNNSLWQTDIWLHNPTDEWMAGEVKFVDGDDPTNAYGFLWPNLNPGKTKPYLDIVGEIFQLDNARGYLVLKGADGSPAPLVSARTFNQDPAGGTFGLNLRPFTSENLLYSGDIGYLAGVSHSADPSVGFRTNLGILNTDEEQWSQVRITIYDLDGNSAVEPWSVTIPPGVYRQWDIFDKLGLSVEDSAGSIKVEILEGGGHAVFATEIDNLTQDSIFIPAQGMLLGPVSQ
jgi:hypothetical protein